MGNCAVHPGCRKSGRKRANRSAPSPSSSCGRIHLSQRERQDWYSIIVNTVLKRVYFDKKITILGSPSGRAGTAYAVTERVSISNLSFQIGFSTSWVHHAQPELSTVYTELSTGRNRQFWYTICKIDGKVHENSQIIPQNREYFRAERGSYQPFAQGYPQTVQNLLDCAKTKNQKINSV